ncbi:MAG: mitochondrial carrier domain-containing protein [Monoraphidium minutum]|nr:MAG: mitochondrial carrier domain-containing protein [Monoraphidium minutum]
MRPASDVLAGALARAASQSIIHPLDTLKVRLQANVRAPAPPPPPPAGAAGPPGALTTAAPPPPPRPPAASSLSKFGRLVPPAGGAQLRAAGAGLASLYKGVFGAASGAGIAIGAYFAFYSASCNVLAAHTALAPGAVAFCGGAAAAAGSSVVKVPLAVCIRSVQAGVYPNVFAAAASITRAAGPAGLFTGYWPTLLEDVPDMACKFAAYESMRQLHRRLVGGRDAAPGEDFAMGALAGAAAAAATTPLDVVKTRMMCAAASRPTMAGAAAGVLAAGGPGAFFAGVGARAVSNGINSAVFFCAFEALRGTLQRRLCPADGAGAGGTAARGDAARGGEEACGRGGALAVEPLQLSCDEEGA